MKVKNKYLDSLAGNHKKLMIFDCEFWHVMQQAGDNNIEFQPNEDFFFTPREIGGLIFKKTTDWSFTKFYVTLSKPKRDVAFPISHFSTVSPQTAYKLDECEKRLGLPWGQAFPSRLSKDGQEAYKEGLAAYNADANIKAHHKPNSWYNKFMEEVSTSMIIVKGSGDITALKNASLLLGFELKKPLEILDIALWNSESRKRCNTAKLAGTFDCIKNKLNEETKKLADHLPLEKAHDPSTDASMTLLIAIFIESQKP